MAHFEKPAEGSWTAHYPELGTGPVSYEDSISPEIHDLECYALGVARLLVRESSKAAKRELEAYDAATRTAAPADPSLERLDRCVQACLDELPPESREIIVEYYSADKHEKIVRRRELAERLGVSVTGLRLRAFRIRQCLAKCVARRLDDEGA